MAEMSRLSHELHTDKHIVNIEHREMIDASESTGTHTHTHTYSEHSAHPHRFTQRIQVINVWDMNKTGLYFTGEKTLTGV